MVRLRKLAPTASANQLPVPTLGPYLQLQGLGRHIDFVTVDPISQPSQHPRPIVFSHRSESVTTVVENPKCPLNVEVLQIPVQNRKIEARIPPIASVGTTIHNVQGYGGHRMYDRNAE